MKCKVFAAVFLIAFMAYSCHDDDDEPLAPPSLDLIEVDDLLNLMPGELKRTEGVAVYVDATGNEKKLKTHYYFTTRVSGNGANEYDQEYFEINYVDPDLIAFTMSIVGTGVYGADREVQKSLSSILMFGQEASCGATIFVEGGEYVIYEWTDFRQELNINEQTYSNVVVGRNDFNTTGIYDVLMLNEVGVTAFADENGKTWAFARFE